MPGGADEKTEKATPKKRRDERKKGNVMMSQDVVAVATLFASYAALRFGLSLMVDAMTGIVRYCIGLVGSVPTGGASAIGTELSTKSIMALAQSVAIPLLATVLAAVVATFALLRRTARTGRQDAIPSSPKILMSTRRPRVEASARSNSR